MVDIFNDDDLIDVEQDEIDDDHIYTKEDTDLINNVDDLVEVDHV